MQTKAVVYIRGFRPNSNLLNLHPFFCHSEKHKSLNVSGIILPPRIIVGHKGRVTVSIEGRRVDRVQTAWFLNDTPISDTSHTGRHPNTRYDNQKSMLIHYFN